MVTVSSLTFTSFSFVQVNTFQRQTLLNKIYTTDPNILAQKETSVIKYSYLENQVLETHLIKNCSVLPSASYYQQHILIIVIYFQVEVSEALQ